MAGRALYPGDSVIAGWAHIAAVAAWASVPAPILTAYMTALGDPHLNAIPVLAAIPPHIHEAAVASLSPATHVDRVRVCMLVNAARLKLHLPLVDLMPPPAPAVAPAAGMQAAAAAQPAVVGPKVRLSMVLDQVRDMEVAMLDREALAAKRARYLALGDPPLQSEQVSDAQLTALSWLHTHGPGIYVDFGVWGPHQLRSERRNKFVAQILQADGTWRSVEIGGPDCFETWEKCWRVFRTGAIMDAVALPSTLDTYAAKFRERVTMFPNSWALAAQADQRCRLEWMVEERRNQEQFAADHPAFSKLDTSMPWNTVFKAAATDRDFWQDEFLTPALKELHAAPEDRQEAGRAGPSAYGTTPARPADPRLAEQHPDGRWKLAADGKDFCFLWGRDGACVDGQCPNRRSHTCEFCRTGHRTIHCPAHPGWQPRGGKGSKGGKGGSSVGDAFAGPRSAAAVDTCGFAMDDRATAGPWRVRRAARPLSRKAAGCVRMQARRAAAAAARSKQRNGGRGAQQLARSSPAAARLVRTEGPGHAPQPGRLGQARPRASNTEPAAQVSPCQAEAARPAGLSAFLDVSGGSEALTRAVARRGLAAATPAGILRASGDGSAASVAVDLREPRVFRKLRAEIRRGRVRWLHGAPPPRSGAASRADTRGGAAPDMLSRHVAALAQAQHRAGGWWSLAFPARSRIRQTLAFLRLAGLAGAQLRRCDLCCYGCSHVVPKGILGNAAFLSEVMRVCPGAPSHLHHSPPDGKVLATGGRLVSRRALCAEPPEDLCEAMAAAYGAGGQCLPAPPAPVHIVLQGRVDAGAPDARKRRRQRENDAAIGGMRSPALSLQQVPGWLPVGARLRSAIDQVYAAHRGGLPGEVAAAASTAVRAAVGLGPLAESADEGLDAALYEALVAAAGVPEVHVPAWIKSHAPLGIVEPIPTCGIFPRVSEDEADRAAELYADPVVLSGGFRNYTSYAENREAADAELQAEDRGSCVKVRLIHDLSRSGVNRNIRLYERIVLPKLSDVVKAARRLLGTQQPGDEVEFMVLDFESAFKMLKVGEVERRFVAGQGAGGYFAYKTVLFGIVSGPLLWGRLAALTTRITASILDQSAADLQFYVDDPILVASGSKSARDLIFGRAVLLWAALRLRLQWKKGRRGSAVDWIGASIAADSAARRVVITLPESKRVELLEAVDQLASVRWAPLRDVRRLAGRASWIAGLLPQLRPFVQQLWAAQCTAPAGKRVGRRQIARALTWLRAFATGSAGPFSRVVRAADPVLHFTVAFDASTTGGGALLYVTLWSHAAAAQAVVGDPGSQARWEVFVLLASFIMWRPVISHVHAGVSFVGDAQGVLQGAVRLASRDPVINVYISEIALRIAGAGVDLESFHIWSEVNTLADDLSRLGEGATLPPFLQDVRRCAFSLPEFRIAEARRSPSGADEAAPRTPQTVNV
ncbi:unnamed protein product [Prorocentrum cordatum]|uniref:Reverse transcriptase domain-containing protein n=1 Tax=Prorocentrum cordatum TaxID=2364126 RepID=A0ABN9YG65_9DINO|nr:unnamed protein product [Polarella glacialis]